MAKCVVIKCDQMYHKNAFDYYALSEHFEELREGNSPPWYTITIDNDLNVAFQRE